MPGPDGRLVWWLTHHDPAELPDRVLPLDRIASEVITRGR
jgi:hypothetical protein